MIYDFKKTCPSYTHILLLGTFYIHSLGFLPQSCFLWIGRNFFLSNLYVHFPPLFFHTALARTSIMMLKGLMKIDFLSLFSNLGENIQYFVFKYLYTSSFSFWFVFVEFPLLGRGNSPSILVLWDFMNRCQFFDMLIWSWFYLISYGEIHWLVLEYYHVCISRINYTWLWSVSIHIYCCFWSANIVVSFCVYIYKGYWSVIFFYCSDFVWFYHQGFSGLTEWIETFSGKEYVELVLFIL